MAAIGGAGNGATEPLDIETIVVGIVASASRKMLLVPKEEYEQVDPTINDMLQWEDSKHKYAQIQKLPSGELARVGTVGDGNCLLHSFLFSLSPTYRAHNKAARSYIADHFRNILIDRIDELRMLADVTYPEIGGAAALEENFEILEGKREELNIEMAPLIAQLYGFNLLAVQVRDDMLFHPVCATHIAYNPALPTVLVNYIGGGLDIGNAKKGFMPGGHYEAIFAPTLLPVLEEVVASGKRTTRKRKEDIPRVMLDKVRTSFIFHHSEIYSLLAQFDIACKPVLSAEAAALMAEIAARNVHVSKNTNTNTNINANLAAAMAASMALDDRLPHRRSSSGSKTRKAKKNRKNST